MKNVYLGRQPIVNKNIKLCAYDILYRDVNKKSAESGNRYTSASVINSVLNKFGTQSILGDRRGFVKIDEKFLMNDIIFSIPNNFFVFTLLKNIPLNEKVVERIEQLYLKGFLLSVNTIELDSKHIEKYRPIFKYLSFVSINLKIDILEDINSMVSEMKSNDITLIGNNIENSEAYSHAIEIGCDWFEGYFFAEPQILENAKYEASQMNVLKLYNLLMQDVNIDEITTEFENNPEITVQLLQFINSGYFHFRNRISSIHHVLTLVGRIAIGQWLMLMIYSKSVSKSERSPLMLMVKNRTELMESILKVVQPDVKSNMLGEAYMVGVLSLVDTIFSMRLTDILESMNISDDVKDALLKSEGILGEIYELIKNTEKFDIKAIFLFEKKYKLEHTIIENLVLQSMQEVQKFENPTQE